jgi:hypothetical protein
LQQLRPRQHPRQLPPADRTGRARIGETLGGQGDPAGGVGAEVAHRRLNRT